MLKVGVIGLGAMGVLHTRVYSELRDVELTGVADIDLKLARGVAEKYNTTCFRDYKDLLKLELDAVSIAVPTCLHREVAVEVAITGTNMLIEKPIASNIEAANEIIKAAQDNSVKLMVGHIERFNPVIPIIFREIQNDNIIQIETTRIGPRPPMNRDTGVIVDLAVHDIDLIRYLTRAEFKHVHAIASTTYSGHEDCAILLSEMTNGALAQVTVNCVTPFKVREINIVTREKYIRASLLGLKINRYWREQGGDDCVLSKELTVPYTEPLKLELQSFVECIKGNSEPSISGEEGLKALDVATRCLYNSSH